MPSWSIRASAACSAGRLAWMSVMTATRSAMPQGWRFGLRTIRRDVVEQAADAGGDVVADPAHAVQVAFGGAVDLPVLVALARVDRARVAAAHRDHRVGRAYDLVGHRLGELLADVDPQLGHRGDHVRVDA